jgi:hypothetical protein
MIRKNTLLLCFALIPMALPAVSLAERHPDSLEERFMNPPAQSRPWVYWWWMGRVSKETITRDLEALKAKGVGGMLLFQCDDSWLPDAVFGESKRVWSPEWVEMVRFANSEAKRLGLDFIINYTDGSTGCSSAPIDLEDSGQIIVHSGIRVTGGARVEIQLPQPEIREGFYRDVAVIAYPLQDSLKQRPMQMINGATVQVSSKENWYYFETEYLVDGDTRTIWTSEAAKPEGEYIDLAFQDPFTAAAVFLLPAHGWRPKVVDVQVSDDGKTYRSAARVDVPRNEPLTLSLPAIASSWFRIAFPGSARVHLSEFRLLAPGESEAGAVSPFKCFAEQIGNEHHSYGGLRAMAEAGSLRKGATPDLADSAKVIDLTAHMDQTGKLTWEAPDGEWEILRFGRSSIGWRSKAGTNDSGSRHVDYLNAEAVKKHFTMGIDPMLRAIGHGKDGALTALHEDSFEMPYNRWTASFLAEFKKRRGYDPLPWLPVLTGRVVESQGASERFLWDYRRTIGDLFITHWEMARNLCHERGLKFQSEAAGPSAYCFDALAQLGRTDIPMGEFWSGIYQPGVPVDDQGRGCWPGTVCETIRQAASAAHVHGRPIVAAESFTGYSRPFVLDPFDIKAIGDRAFCDGLNRNVIHLFMTQPIEQLDGKPVVVRTHALDYNIRSTWFDISRFWTDYLARCSAMLQAGRHVADVCCFVGEGTPALVPQREYNRPAIPKEFDYDACNREVLLTATFKNGRIHLPSGANYAVLTLPPDLCSMTPELLGHIRDLVGDGATLLGPRPEYSPSLYDHEKVDAQVAAMAGDLWGASREQVGEHVFGKGRVMWGKSVEEALASANCEPACVIKGTDSVLFIQRLTEHGDVFFISQQTNAAINFTASFRAPDTVIPEFWDPATGKREEAMAFNQVDGRVEMPIHLDPRGSVFVVLRPGTPENHLLAVTSRDAAVDELKIINARYASKENPDKSVDVTRQVAAAVRGDQLNMRVWPDALGVADPAPNEVKILTLDYAVNGNMHSTHAPDGRRIIVDADDNEQDYKIVRDEGRLTFVSSTPGTYELRYADGYQDTITVSAIPSEMDLSSGWELTFEKLGENLTLDTLISWTELPDQEMRFYSGTVTYRRRFAWSERPGRVELDLGRMKNIAEVSLNGKTLGLLWKPPYRLDVTTALKAGDNELEVKVTNLLVNRITGDYLAPPEEKELHAFGAIEQYRPYAKEDGLLPSGLFGPVLLRTALEVELRPHGSNME